MSVGMTQVEFGAPGYSPFQSGTNNGDLTYHAPAFLAAVEDCNRLYAGFLNFTLTFILAKNASFHSIRDDSSDMIAEWYYRHRLFPLEGIASILLTCKAPIKQSYSFVNVYWAATYFCYKL